MAASSAGRSNEVGAEVTATRSLPPSRRGVLLLEDLDRGRRSAPPAGHVLDDLGQDLFLLDRVGAAEVEVVEGACPAGRDDVEPGQVPARRAPVARPARAGA